MSAILRKNVSFFSIKESVERGRFEFGRTIIRPPFNFISLSGGTGMGITGTGTLSML